MKKILWILLFSFWLWPAIGYSASDAECSIWLCAPQGFVPSSCKPARKAMIKRAFKGKSIIPSLSSCMAKRSSPQQGEPTITATQGFASKRDGVWTEKAFCMKKDIMMGRCSRSISISVDGQKEGETYYFSEYD